VEQSNELLIPCEKRSIFKERQDKCQLSAFFCRSSNKRMKGHSVFKSTLARLGELAAYNPQRSRIILEVALVGLAVIGLWGLYADFFLSNLVVVAVIIVMVALYGSAIAILMGNLVRETDRWQVESA